MAAYTTAYNASATANYPLGEAQGKIDGYNAGLNDGLTVAAGNDYWAAYDNNYDAYYDISYNDAYNNYYYSGYNDGFDIGETAGENDAPCTPESDSISKTNRAQLSLKSPRLLGLSNKTNGVLTAKESSILSNLVAIKGKDGKIVQQRLLTTHPDSDTDKATSKNPSNVAPAVTSHFDKLQQKMITKRASLQNINKQALELTKGIGKTAVTY
jgi:hypothetical protein